VKDISIENLQVYGKTISSVHDFKLHTEYTKNISVK